MEIFLYYLCFLNLFEDAAPLTIGNTKLNNLSYVRTYSLLWPLFIAAFVTYRLFIKASLVYLREIK